MVPTILRKLDFWHRRKVVLVAIDIKDNPSNEFFEQDVTIMVKRAPQDFFKKKTRKKQKEKKKKDEVEEDGLTN